VKLKMLRWTVGRRALVVALVVTLTLLWLVASWSGNLALSILYIVSALAYVAGAVVGSVVMSRWIWRHRAIPVLTGMVAGRFPLGQSWPLRRPLAMGRGCGRTR
jgi:hypothetical protein